jgi:hypothetical protein
MHKQHAALALLALALLALAGCTVSELEPLDVTPADAPVNAEQIIERAWELVDGADEPPAVTWTANCIPSAGACRGGVHRNGEVFVYVSTGFIWSTSLTHELIHARLWRESGDGNGEHTLSEWDLEDPVNETLRQEFAVLINR